MKKIQLWLHNNYEAIRFWVAMLVALVVLAAIYTVLMDNRNVTQQRAKQIESIVKELKNDNERQTQLIACLLAIHGDAESISTEDEAKCRKEASQQIENNSNNVNSSGEPLSPSSRPGGETNTRDFQPTEPTSSDPPQSTPEEDTDVPLIPEAIEDLLGL